MDLLFILIGAGLAIFVIFVSFKSIGAGIAAKSEINRQKDKLKSDEIEEEEILEEEELNGNRGRIPLRSQRECTGLSYDVPYMVTEFNGHMFPTKSIDNELRQNEHVLRHLQVLNAAYGDSKNAGAIGWCAFDYNTHKDFGSGDRICYHGVMDMFREPKFASYVYSSQDNAKNGIVLEPVTVWARGERNIQGVLPLIILTNCDYVEFQFNDSEERFSINPDFKNFSNFKNLIPA